MVNNFYPHKNIYKECICESFHATIGASKIIAGPKFHKLIQERQQEGYEVWKNPYKITLSKLKQN